MLVTRNQDEPKRGEAASSSGAGTELVCGEEELQTCPPPSSRLWPCVVVAKLHRVQKTENLLLVRHSAYRIAEEERE